MIRRWALRTEIVAKEGELLDPPLVTYSRRALMFRWWAEAIARGVEREMWRSRRWIVHVMVVHERDRPTCG